MIRSTHLYRVSLPLIEPYHLSYGPLKTLESLWAKIVLADGREGWGESTPVPGYSDSDVAAVWAAGQHRAVEWLGRSAEDVLAHCPDREDGFLVTALWTAFESACGRIPAVEGAIPIVGLVQEAPAESPGEALQRVSAKGYRYFKVKVGYHDPDLEVKRLRDFQKALGSEQRIRVDANQALDEKAAIKLLEVCDAAKIEFFEQPLPVAAWEATARLTRAFPTTILLDESLTSLASLDRVVEHRAAGAVKLKWMKQIGWGYLAQMLDRASALGLRVVLGNGVASHLNNWHEAMFWLARLRDSGVAGEMNGFLKLADIPAGCGLDFAHGCVIAEATPGPQRIPDHVAEELDFVL